MPSPKNQNLFPEDLQHATEEQEKEKFKEIEKETRHELFIEKYKQKFLKYFKWGCLILIFIIIFAIVVNFTIFKFIGPSPSIVSPTVSPSDKPGENFKITIEKTKILPDLARENMYDAAVQINNKDLEWGVKRLKYKFILKDFFGNVIAQRDGESYILPQQSRYLIELGIIASGKVESLEAEFEPKEVQKLKDFENPQLQMRASDQGSTVSGQKIWVTANIFNDSFFGYEKVDANVLIYDATDNLIGVNFTNFNTFAAGTKREIQTNWDYVIPTKIARVEVETNVNVFENGAFMKQYSAGQLLEY